MPRGHPGWGSPEEGALTQTRGPEKIFWKRMGIPRVNQCGSHMQWPPSPLSITQILEISPPGEAHTVCISVAHCPGFGVNSFFIHRHRMVRPRSPWVFWTSCSIQASSPPRAWRVPVIRPQDSLELFEEPRTGCPDPCIPCPPQPSSVDITTLICKVGEPSQSLPSALSFCFLALGCWEDQRHQILLLPDV